MTDTKLINIEGKEYGFKFTMLTLKLLCEKSGIDLFDIEKFIKGKPIDGVINLLQCANKVYNRGKELNEYEVDDLINAMSQEQLQEIFDTFLASMTNFGSKLGTGNGEEKKLTWDEVLDYGLGDLDLLPDEFWNLMFCDFIRKLHGYNRRTVEQWRHTRMIVAVFAGKSPREVLPLPGDFEHLTNKSRTKESVIEQMKRDGVYKKWKIDEDKIIY